MTRKVHILILGLLMLTGSTVRSVHAQGHFVRHGFQVTMPELALGQDRSTLAFRAGYHLFGAVEVGLGLERRSDFDTDVVTVSLTPGVAIYPLRKLDAMPVMLRLGVSFENQSLSGDPITALETEGILTDGHAWRWEAGISRRMPIHRAIAARRADLLPILSITYRKIEVEQERVILTDTIVTITLDVLLDVDVGGMAHVVAGPRLGVDEHSLVAGFSMRLVAGIAY